MSQVVVNTETKKNNKGKTLYEIKTVQPQNNKGKITLNTLNEVYKKYRKQAKKPFMLKVMTIDGMKTLKNFDYDEDDLQYNLEDYYSSLPKTVAKKFDEFFYFQIVQKH